MTFFTSFIARLLEYVPFGSGAQARRYAKRRRPGATTSQSFDDGDAVDSARHPVRTEPSGRRGYKTPTIHRKARDKARDTVVEVPPRRMKRKKNSVAVFIWHMCKKLLSFLFGWVSVMRLASLALSGVIVLAVFVMYIAQDLPDIRGLAMIRQTPSIEILARDGSVINSYGDVYGEYLTYEELPPALINAVVATEDRRFFDHFGIDPLGIARAMVVNVTAGRLVQGGSTITQQLAKNVFLTPERSLKRKAQEALLALWLESRFSKQEIVSIYLNRVYLGAGNYGVDAAARHYFGISARKLNVVQSAMMAGLLKAPSSYAPTRNPELAKRRTHQVLLNMVAVNMLAEADVQPALSSLHFPDRLNRETVTGDYYADWIVDQLPDVIGRVDDNLIITTTYEPAMQEAAQAALEAQFSQQIRTNLGANQMAMLAMRPDGAVVALIGGTNHRVSQYNRATNAMRQPGSAFKMFVYLAAMEAGYTPDSMINDAPVRIGKWQPQNYKEKYFGVVSLRTALAKSLNTVAVQLGRDVGYARVADAARRLGITSTLQATPSITLGSLEANLLDMTTAYAHLANGGKGVRAYGITKIISKRTKEVLYAYEAPLEYTVIRPSVVAMMNDMLQGVVQSGTARAANIGRPAAGKTGTASDYKDAWFMGYTPELVAGVWVGNDDATPTKRVTGGSVPARIWHDFMQTALKDTPVAALPINYRTQDALPWLQQEAAPDAASDDNQADLDEGFWDKLFDDGSAPAIENSFPSERQQRGFQ